MLAATVLTAVLSLAATLWVQAAAVSAGATADERTVRLQRVTALAAEQWGDRRATIFNDPNADSPTDDRRAPASRDSSDESDSSAIDPPSDHAWDRAMRAAERRSAPGAAFAHDSVTFVTASPVLFPDWPLVVAAYRIERSDILQPDRDEPWYALTYTETRVLDPAGAARAGAAFDRTPDERPTSDKLVLLWPVAELAFERFGPDVWVEEQRPGPGPGAAAANAPPSRDAAPHDWWPMRDRHGYRGPIHTVRLVGSFMEERFTCVFAAEPSR